MTELDPESAEEQNKINNKENEIVSQMRGRMWEEVEKCDSKGWWIKSLKISENLKGGENGKK